MIIAVLKGILSMRGVKISSYCSVDLNFLHWINIFLQNKQTNRLKQNKIKKPLFVTSTYFRELLKNPHLSYFSFSPFIVPRL